MLLVVPAIGVSVTATVPPCATRPDSGTCIACVLCEGALGATICAETQTPRISIPTTSVHILKMADSIRLFMNRTFAFPFKPRPPKNSSSLALTEDQRKYHKGIEGFRVAVAQPWLRAVAIYGGQGTVCEWLWPGAGAVLIR